MRILTLINPSGIITEISAVLSIQLMINPSGIITEISAVLSIQLMTCIISGKAIKLRGFVGMIRENMER